MEDEDEQERMEAKHQMHCKCPKMYAPVCGSDSVTYHNRCFMQCTSKYKYEGNYVHKERFYLQYTKIHKGCSNLTAL